MSNHDETARRIVSQEVRYCVSSLVSELMKGAYQDGALIDEDEAMALAGREPGADEFEEASGDHDDGLEIRVTDDDEWQVIDKSDGEIMDCGEANSDVEAWRAAFDAAGRDHPDGCEALEHWLVTDWLAEKLRDHGESVADLESLGLTVWARCTSGQAIYADYVLQQIAAGIDA